MGRSGPSPHQPEAGSGRASDVIHKGLIGARVHLSQSHSNQLDIKVSRPDTGTSLLLVFDYYYCCCYYYYLLRTFSLYPLPQKAWALQKTTRPSPLSL